MVALPLLESVAPESLRAPAAQAGEAAGHLQRVQSPEVIELGGSVLQ